MSRIAIVYFSATGTTAKLAEAVRSGASEVLDTAVYRITGDEIVAGRFANEDALGVVDAADAVIFGSPTYMGGPSAQFKAFADATGDRWGDRRWVDKVAAGFTTGSCPNGDQTHTLTYFTVLAAQHGMIWCNLDIPGGCDSLGRNRLGAHTGLASQSSDGALPVADLLTAHHLGKRVASLTLLLSAGKAKKSTSPVG